MNSSNHESRSKTLVISDNDDDEPEFIGPVLGGLAEKYRFKEVSSSTAAGKLSRPTKEMSRPSSKSNAKRKSDAVSAPTVKTRGKSDSLSKQPGSHTLLPDIGLEPDSVPKWLGRTSVLLQLQACPICKVRWKGKESGIARAVRDICQSVDLLFIDRQTLHLICNSNDVGFFTRGKNLLDNRKFNTRNDSKGRKPGNVATVTGLTSVTNVHPSDNRGKDWEEEVRSRVRDWIGPSSPSALSDNENALIQLSPSSENIRSASPIRIRDDDYFPPTQPFGASSLAQAYPKSGSSISSPTSSNSLRLSKMSPNPSSAPAQREILVPASDSEEEDIKEPEPMRDLPSEKICRVHPDQMIDITFGDEDVCQRPFLSRRDSRTAGNPSGRKR